MGEGPVWDEQEQVLYWVDIKAPAIHRLNPRTDKRESWPMPEPIGCISLRRQGGLIAALQTGFFTVDLASGAVEKIGDPEPNHPGNRFNDGKCDTSGRFWAGTMDDSEKEATGSFYRLDSDLTWQQVDSGYIVFNGPAFSPDGKTVYHTDSAKRTVYASSLGEANTLEGKQPFIVLNDDEGYPDGMTVDAEGCLWVAHWDGWRITRFSPEGKKLSQIDLPAARITSCVFGGQDMSTLFITSASIGLDENSRGQQPLAGGVFRVETGVKGLPTQRFAG